MQADGRQVMTVEGLEKDAKLDPIQEGFMQEHGLQCGYCTPGMLVTLGWLQAQKTRDSPRDSPSECLHFARTKKSPH